MNYFRITLFSFILGLFFAGFAFAQDETRAIQTWKVEKYDISATLPQDESGRSLVSRATIKLKNVIGRPASSLTLRISPLAEVSGVNINGSVTDFTKSEEKTGTGTLQRIAMRFPAIASDATLTASVDYKITVKDNSSLNALSPSGSQFLPLSYWYPTPTNWFFPRGADWAPFRVKISGGSLTGISSGTQTAGGYENKLNGQPFFAAGSWDTINSNGVEVLTPKGASADGQKRAAELAALLSEARKFISGILGTAPDTPLRIVAVHRGAGFSDGGTVFVEDAVFRRSRIDALTVMNIAEAAAKLWLGNATAVIGDGGGVIREGLSRYIATQFIESKFGKDVADVERTRQRAAYAVVVKREVAISQVSPLDDSYYPEVANKGAMIWRILARRIGQNDFNNILRTNIQNGPITLARFREAFSSQKELLDYFLNAVTDMNLLAGLPQTTGNDTRVNLRNTGSVDASVNVTAFGSAGQSIEAPTIIKAQSFGEVTFKTQFKIVRVEVDSEKLYPQTDYSDDIAEIGTHPLTDSDVLLAVKRSFDKQDYSTAEKTAVNVLRDLPRYDEVRILLGRSLLAEGRPGEAEKEFRAVLDEKLPSVKSSAWANEGLAEAAAKGGHNDQALSFSTKAIAEDADYGASLAARAIRNKLGSPTAVDSRIKAFFADFDRAAESKRKADVDALILPGEVTKFGGGIAGSAEMWQTQVRQVDRIDSNTVLVEANLSIKLLNRDPESGTAVFRLTKSGSGWKLSGVDLFEVK